MLKSTPTYGIQCFACPCSYKQKQTGYKNSPWENTKLGTKVGVILKSKNSFFGLIHGLVLLPFIFLLLNYRILLN